MFAPLPGPVEPGAAGGRGNAQTPADFLVGQALLVGHFQQLAVPFRQLSGKNLVQGAAGGGERGRQPIRVGLPGLVFGPDRLAGKGVPQLVLKGFPKPPGRVGVVLDLGLLVQQGQKDLLGQVVGQLRVLEPVPCRPVQVRGVGQIQLTDPVLMFSGQEITSFGFGYPFTITIP